jgi:3-hydroxyacyl-CoA dehydrogenase
MNIQYVSVIGSGIMGCGNAYIFALKGFDIRLIDIDKSILDKAVITISNNLDRQIKKGTISWENKNSASSKINTIVGVNNTPQYSDLVIEAIYEDKIAKKKIFNSLESIIKKEAIFTLMEGVASAEDIDKVIKLGMNHPMGPLTLADFIGLDTCIAIMNVLYDGFNDSKYRPCPLLKKMVAANILGRKTGEGFFKYTN